MAIFPNTFGNVSQDGCDTARNPNLIGVTAAPLFPEPQFRRMLGQERKRSERSRKHLLLMLIEDQTPRRRKGSDALLNQIAGVVCSTIRDTDVPGWFTSNTSLGVIFTELGATETRTAVRIIESKIKAVLQEAFEPDKLEIFKISFCAFPEGWISDGDFRQADPTLYPDLLDFNNRRVSLLMLKRGIDILGSLFALTILSPVFLLIAILVKLTSDGPVFFRQQRVGQNTANFTFLKFRSMIASSNHGIHQEFMKSFIAGKPGKSYSDEKQNTIYKMTDDPRITRIGKILRRTSLDELPQFWNVLVGEMSLVGPRPPIPYEFEAYDFWHRRRVLEVKPGITGLWQVRGRSTTTFDEMVRLDLQYSRTWTPMLDVKILLQTPRAIFSGVGAY
jgi:lipopolysaccharide/colanic/teichoic acid biosynthesis glycosyltransferase